MFYLKVLSLIYGSSANVLECSTVLPHSCLNKIRSFVWIWELLVKARAFFVNLELSDSYLFRPCTTKFNVGRSTPFDQSKQLQTVVKIWPHEPLNFNECYFLAPSIVFSPFFCIMNTFFEFSKCYPSQMPWNPVGVRRTKFAITTTFSPNNLICVRDCAVILQKSIFWSTHIWRSD